MTAPKKFRYVMREFKNKELHHGTTGDIVSDRKQAMAIAFSEAQKIDPSYGKYEDGGEIYATGGEIMRKYKADDYFPMGDNIEFMFDTKSGADKMANDYNVSVIEDGESFYVPVGKTKMEDGGKTMTVGEKLCEACDKDDKIPVASFITITGNNNPKTIERFEDARFERCLFSPHYKFVTKVEEIIEYEGGGLVKRTMQYAKLSNSKRYLQKRLKKLRAKEVKVSNKKKKAFNDLTETNKKLKRLGV